MLIYLGISAVGAFAASFLLVFFAAPTHVAAAHLVFAVGVLPLIVGVTTHFIPVLTRSGPPHRGVQRLPVLLQICGLLAFFYFQGLLGSAALHAAAGMALLASLYFAGWVGLRARRTLGKPHPGWRWYLAATACLILALIAVLAMALWPQATRALRLFHLHLNTLGFIGLSAVGTLQVLMPTVLSGPDPEAAARLRRDLPLFLAGVTTVATGAALYPPLALPGVLLLSIPCWRLLIAWLKRYTLRSMWADGASAALLAAFFGFLGLLILGALHGFSLLDGWDAVPAFVAMFLLPLVTGALSQLLPVWQSPGANSPLRRDLRALLITGGRWRGFVFLGGGLLLATGRMEGAWLALAGLLHFVLCLLRAGSAVRSVRKRALGSS